MYLYIKSINGGRKMINYNAQDEQLFVAVSNLIAGDMDSYYTMYDLSIKYIYKIIYDIVKDYHTTEDLIQETYITIFNKINTLQDSRKFYSWAGRIATNHTLRYIQSNRRELLTLDQEDGDSDFIFDLASQDNEEFIPENILMDMEKQRLIAEIIDGLSVDQKLVIQYFYYEELSVGEIAALMGCPAGTIKSRLSYARKAIKDAVIDLDVNENTRLYSLSALPLFFLLFKVSVDKFVFANAVATGVGIAGAVGEGTAGGAGAIGEGAASGGAGAVGGASSGTVSGTSAGGAVATSASKGLLAKIGTSLGAKIAIGVAATGLVVTGGIAIHHVVTEDKDVPTEITTEVIEEASDLDASQDAITTTQVGVTEETTEATTEAVVEEVTVSEQECLAFSTLAINLTSANGWNQTLDMDNEMVWSFVGYMNNNAQYDGVETQFMPKSVEMNVYSFDEMKAYASNVFGVENLEYVSNYWFSDRGDGTYYLTLAQMADLHACRLKTVTVDGDRYTVTGLLAYGEVSDFNHTEPSYSVNSINYDFTMELVKSEESPFGFRVISISYVQADSNNFVSDLGNTEPPVVTVVGAGGDGSSDGNTGAGENTTASVEMNASVIDPNTTDPTMKKYLEIIDGVCNKGLWPDNALVQDYELSDIPGNKYGVLDIDGDGRKELIISIQNTSSFAYILRIYDYDASTDKLTLQFSSNPRIDIYANGALVNKDSSNQSSSVATDITDPTWPYTLYKYDGKTNTYVVVARVQAWNGEWRPDGFPAEYDKDGNKNIYEVIIYKNGDSNSVESSTYMDDLDYREWRKQHFLLDDPVANYLAEPMSNVLR